MVIYVLTEKVRSSNSSRILNIRGSLLRYPEEKMDGVLRSLRGQLDDDYVLLRPKNKLSCICIALKENLQEKDKEFIFE